MSAYVILTAVIGFTIAVTDVSDELTEFSILEKVALVVFWPVSLFVVFLIGMGKLRNKLTSDKPDKLLDK